MAKHINRLSKGEMDAAKVADKLQEIEAKLELGNATKLIAVPEAVLNALILGDSDVGDNDKSK